MKNVLDFGRRQWKSMHVKYGEFFGWIETRMNDRLPCHWDKNEWQRGNFRITCMLILGIVGHSCNKNPNHRIIFFRSYTVVYGLSAKIYVGSMTCSYVLNYFPKVRCLATEVCSKALRNKSKKSSY